MSTLVERGVPVAMWRRLQGARHDATVAGRLAEYGSPADVVSCIDLLAGAGDAMAAVASHPDLPVSAARRLRRTRDILDAHVLAARSVHELALTDDARRFVQRGAATVIAAFEPDVGSA